MNSSYEMYSVILQPGFPHFIYNLFKSAIGFGFSGHVYNDSPQNKHGCEITVL